MEVSKKKPAAGVPAAKEPAPTLASGKYTFSKAEALRRYLSRKQARSGKRVSKAKRDEVSCCHVNLCDVGILMIGLLVCTAKEKAQVC
jgi:hypothetical protein